MTSSFKQEMGITSWASKSYTAIMPTILWSEKKRIEKQGLYTDYYKKRKKRN